MHKLIEYICDELEELERKAGKDGKLSMAEIQYMDTLAHTKKNLLKADELWEESDYSMDGGSYEGGYSRADQGGNRGGNRGSYRGGSYARRGRGGRRGGANQYGSYASRGGYSMGGSEMVNELRELMQDAPDEQTRMEFQRFIQKIEQM